MLCGMNKNVVQAQAQVSTLAQLASISLGTVTKVTSAFRFM